MPSYLVEKKREFLRLLPQYSDRGGWMRLADHLRVSRATAKKWKLEAKNAPPQGWREEGRAKLARHQREMDRVREKVERRMAEIDAEFERTNRRPKREQ